MNENATQSKENGWPKHRISLTVEEICFLLNLPAEYAAEKDISIPLLLTPYGKDNNGSYYDEYCDLGIYNNDDSELNENIHNYLKTIIENPHQEFSRQMNWFDNCHLPFDILKRTIAENIKEEPKRLPDMKINKDGSITLRYLLSHYDFCLLTNLRKDNPALKPESIPVYLRLTTDDIPVFEKAFYLKACRNDKDDHLMICLWRYIHNYLRLCHNNPYIEQQLCQDRIPFSVHLKKAILNRLLYHNILQNSVI